MTKGVDINVCKVCIMHLAWGRFLVPSLVTCEWGISVALSLPAGRNIKVMGNGGSFDFPGGGTAVGLPSPHVGYLGKSSTLHGPYSFLPKP